MTVDVALVPDMPELVTRSLGQAAVVPATRKQKAEERSRHQEDRRGFGYRFGLIGDPDRKAAPTRGDVEWVAHEGLISDLRSLG
jgi:hypothetical protein